MYTVYGVGFWYGVKLIFDDIERCNRTWTCSNEYTPEKLVIIFFSVLLGGFQIGQSAPYAEAVSQGRQFLNKHEVLKNKIIAISILLLLVFMIKL